ncbi:hypothetical protein PHLCEN_2v10352 [Hermanssonia centrifuga]|uniref:Transcription factor domain-containing protein n=1 Tax=Hermanssonia centrifuga TaxID=98765 RepID=A0A2R6NN32_9APHY|nr:hypothetical protein PHLCEN_2v10352 [Hermanssonia centrifuga]
MAEPEPPLEQGGEAEMSFDAWKHRFSLRCLTIVHEQAFGARTPNYKTIQELDKKVRSFYVPPSLRVPGFGGAKTMEVVPPPIELVMQRHTVFAIREMTIFYLHRGFFARAIEDSPEDPLGSKYAPSVLAAYTSACTFVGLVKSLHSQHPRLTERLWFLFTHVFSCAIVLGSIAAKSPGLPFARSALVNLDSACNLFEVVRENDRAAKVLPVLRKLKAKAVLAMTNQPTTQMTTTLRLSPGGSIIKDEDEELAALGGKTRLVPRKSPSLPSSPQDAVQHSTPSPRGSPVQHFTPDGVPLIAGPSMPNGVNSTHWQTFSQHGDDIYQNYYSVSSSQWSPDSEYGQVQSPTMVVGMGPMQYPAYDHMHAPMDSYAPSHSPMETPMQTADPHASWQNLFAQFNQA